MTHTIVCDDKLSYELEHINQLRPYLDAEIAVGYDENPGVWVVGSGAELTRAELENTYNSSEWYSARYAAGRVLGNDVDRQIGYWLDEIKKCLSATRKVDREVEEPYQTTEMEISKGYCGEHTRTGTVKVTKTFDIIQEEIRLKAARDALELFKQSRRPSVKHLLEECYHRNDFKPVRIIAGKALGYSSTRIWSHEHPLLTATSAAGAISAGYALVQYLR